jgi:phosphatidate cytidylyltransferase
MGPPLPRLSSLAKRAFSALALAPPVLAAVWFGPPWSDILIVAAAAILLWEWLRLVGHGGVSAAVLLSAGTLLGSLLLGALAAWTWAFVLLSGGTVLAALLARQRPLWLAAAGPYLGLPGLALLWLRDRPDGLEAVVWLLLVVWSVDIFAYVAGRAIGGPLLWPRVSPRKTWAGLAGGVAAAALVGGLLTLAAAGRDAFAFALLAAVLAVVAQGGDLLESAVKRHFGVKDASGIIPGHGGLLDRVDGLLAASLAFAAALWLALV